MDLTDDDRDEIASTFADLGGSLVSWLGVLEDERGEADPLDNRATYMREARSQRLPEAVRWRQDEAARRKASAPAKRRDSGRKVGARRPELLRLHWPGPQSVLGWATMLEARSDVARHYAEWRRRRAPRRVATVRGEQLTLASAVRWVA